MDMSANVNVYVCVCVCWLWLSEVIHFVLSNINRRRVSNSHPDVHVNCYHRIEFSIVLKNDKQINRNIHVK